MQSETAPTLANGSGKTLRLLVKGGGVIAQLFEGDPAAGGRYVGPTMYPAKTLDEVMAVYERRGWTRVKPEAGA